MWHIIHQSFLSEFWIILTIIIFRTFSSHPLILVVDELLLSYNIVTYLIWSNSFYHLFKYTEEVHLCVVCLYKYYRYEKFYILGNPLWDQQLLHITTYIWIGISNGRLRLKANLYHRVQLNNQRKNLLFVIDLFIKTVYLE